MEFEALSLAGAYKIKLQTHPDERGFFARLWDSEEFAGQGLNSNLAQTSLSHNPRRGTLRGLHYQPPPHAEAKVVTCVRGSIWDVIVDLRPGSPTYCQWHGETLDGESPAAIYVPEGFAHGFLTMSDDTLVLYQISRPHEPDLARGVRWNDPAFGIEWPAAPIVIGARDQSYPSFEPGDRIPG